jgi:fatty-acid peroxygenase
MTKAIPHDPAFDSTLALLREGYDFIAGRCDRLSTDIFATRLMLKRAICIRGASAAEMFYGGSHFTRNGAMPQMTMRLLQDRAVSRLSTTACIATARQCFFPSCLRRNR